MEHNTIDQITERLNELLPEVLKVTGFKNLQSLNAKIGGKHAWYIGVKTKVINSPEHFISLYLEGFKKRVEEELGPGRAEYETFQLLKKHQIFREYFYLFLKRTYLRNYEAYSKLKPSLDEIEIWIGQNNANYGIFVTPFFYENEWRNSSVKVRHFPKGYWTIGHILETGLVIPDKEEKIEFSTVDDYLNFFKNVLVRNSGSTHEYAIAELYCEFVKEQDDPENIPILIPEFRYEGKEKKHKYRLDFTIIDSEFNKIGFELSPWSTHGYLSKTKSLTQKEINEIAQNNFEKEMKKHKDFFREHGVFSLIYTDEDLKDYNKVFEDMKKFLVPKEKDDKIKFEILNEFFG
ncbi:MAG: hypothetical protein R2879_04805 [Saprospiraceae bacterium]